MASSPFQITGVASGIGWDEIIDKMITAAKKPAEQWQHQIDTLEYKRTLYQEVTSKIYAMRGTMTSLKLPSAYKKKAAEWIVRSPAGTDASNIIKATPNANAEIAAWDIEVLQLAKAQRHVSNRFAPGDALGLKGTVRIQVGIQVAMLDVEESDSIRTINQKINKLTAPDGSPLAVTAQLIDNRLVIESAVTGLNNEGPLSETLLVMHDSLYKDVTGQGGVTAREYQSYLPQPATGSSFPPQLYSVKSGNATYREGLDFTYDEKTGIINWLASDSIVTPPLSGYNPKRPADGEEIELVIRADLKNLTSGSADSQFSTGQLGPGEKIDLMPTLSTGAPYKNLPGGGGPQNENSYILYDTTDGRRLVNGTDYVFGDVVDDYGVNRQVIKWLNTSTAPAQFGILVGQDDDYTVSHHKMHLIEEDMTSPNSVLAGLGITTIVPGVSFQFPPDQVVEAQDAKLTINGVNVTRSWNTIPHESDESDALIANVKLELTGVGDVTMNITQDVTEVIENLQKFVDSYNELVELINYRLEEKYNSNTQTDDNDYLQSILSASRGTTTFGILHGDQLLWSVKNQMRRYFSDSIPSLSSDLRSRKFLHPASALDMRGSFYVNTGAKTARIDISPTDSLENIQRKLTDATAINGPDGTSASNTELGLIVDIVDGQLVIKAPSRESNLGTEPHLIQRTSGQDYDQLPFVPYMGPPVNGVMTVRDMEGITTYEEGVDYRLDTRENASGVLESRIEWLTAGKKPTANSTYAVDYVYEAAAVGYTAIAGTGDISGLDLHYDASRIQLVSLGLSTEQLNHGKSGLIEFDQDKFFEAIQNDPDMVSSVMLTFMEKMDGYIGNLVDSSSILVAGTIVTKGRFAAALNSIDSEVSSLSEQITKLEKQLEDRQAAMYKQYSDMEQAIQQLNAQMSSMAQFFSQSTAAK